MAYGFRMPSSLHWLRPRDPNAQVNKQPGRQRDRHSHRYRYRATATDTDTQTLIPFGLPMFICASSFCSARMSTTYNTSSVYNFLHLSFFFSCSFFLFFKDHNYGIGVTPSFCYYIPSQNTRYVLSALALFIFILFFCLFFVFLLN